MFYGWKLACVVFFGNFILQGSALYAMNAFMEPLTVLHRWSRMDINMTLTMASVCSSLTTPFIASLTTRFSLRHMISVAMLFGGISFVCLGYTQSLWIFAVLLSVVWIAAQALSSVGSTMLIERWFFKYRARAFGLVSSGMSCSGVFIPFIALFLLDYMGVQWAYAILGASIILFAPFCYYMIRDTPEELGLSVDGITPMNGEIKKTIGKTLLPLTTKELLKNPSVWILGLTVSIAIMAMSAVVTQLKPHFVDEGFSSHTAMLWVSLTALCATFGKYAWGRLSDTLTPLQVLKLLLFCNAASLSIILLPQRIETTISFAVLYGFCYGGIFVILPGLIDYLFGQENFLPVYRIILACIIFKALGYPIIGLSYDATGSYILGYALFVGLLSCAFFASLFLKEPKKN